jgi:hypothetical protein
MACWGGNASLLVASAAVKRWRLPPKIRNPSVDLNDIQGSKKSPLPSNAFIRTGWLANPAVEPPVLIRG